MKQASRRRDTERRSPSLCMQEKLIGKLENDEHVIDKSTRVLGLASTDRSAGLLCRGRHPDSNKVVCKRFCAHAFDASDTHDLPAPFSAVRMWRALRHGSRYETGVSLPPKRLGARWCHRFVGRASDLEAFSHNLADGSLAPMPFQTSARPNVRACCSSRTEQDCRRHN